MRLPRDCMWGFPLLLVALLSQPLTAQGYPWAFMPMCVGDETWWISVSDSGAGHTLPVFTSMRIDRDTVIEAQRYFYVDFPAEAGIAEGWIRSDSAGLHVWNGTSEQRILPSWVSEGDLVNGVKVTAITYVRTPFGDARSFTLQSGGGVTWTDGIGLWAFNRIVGGRSRTFTWMARNACGATPHREPAGFTAPIRDGDILVHRLKSEEQPELGFQILAARKGTGGREWIAATSMHHGRRENRNFFITMSPAGMVHYEGNDRYGVQPRLDYYPTYLPPVDEFTVGNCVMRVVARFDTIIFSETVDAFTLKSTRSDLDRVITIADRFGLVYERVQGLEAVLHSAVINGKKYNRTQERRRFLPLCSGSTFAYRRFGPENNDVGYTSMRDTTAQGVPAVSFSLPAMPVPGRSIMMTALDGSYRDTVEGVLDGNGELVLPAAVDLGDRAPTGIVVSIGQRVVFGALRAFLATVDIDNYALREDMLVENIGLYSSRLDEQYGGTFEWRLLGGVICGEAVGVTSEVADLAGGATAPRIELYPNPATAGGTVHIGIVAGAPAHGRLLLRDMLGRIAMDEIVALVPGMNAITRSSRGLAPGVYAVSLTMDAAHISTLLLLR